MKPGDTATGATAGPADVSVVMPVHNGERYIAEALQSIRSQTVACRQIIVVDDGSTDQTAAVVRRFPEVTLVGKAHGGIAETLNRGLELVASEFVAFLDADDRWTPRKTELQLAALRAEPGISMVFGHARRFAMTPDGERVLDVLPGVTKVGALFRSAAFLRVGRFEPGQADFIDWFARAREAGLNFRIDDDIVYERRIHDANDGIVRRDGQRKDYHATLKAMLDRRRKL